MNLMKNKKTEVKEFLKEMKANRTNQSSNKNTVPLQQKRSYSNNYIHSQAEIRAHDGNTSSNYHQDFRIPQPQMMKNTPLSQSSSRSQYGSQSNVYQNFNDNQFSAYNYYSQVPYNQYNNDHMSSQNRYFPLHHNMHRNSQLIYQNSNPFPIKESPILKRSSQSQIYDSYETNQFNQEFPDRNNHHLSYQKQSQSNLPIVSYQNAGSNNAYQRHSIQRHSTQRKSSQNYYKASDQKTKAKHNIQQPAIEFNQYESDYHNFNNFSQIGNMEAISQISDGHQGSQNLNNNMIYQDKNFFPQKQRLQKKRLQKTIDKTGQLQTTNKLKPQHQVNIDLIKSETVSIDQNTKSIDQNTKKKQFHLISKDFQVVVQPEKVLAEQKDSHQETKVKKRRQICCDTIQSNFREGMTKIRQSLPTVKNFVEACRQQLLWIQKQREKFQSNKLNQQIKIKS